MSELKIVKPIERMLDQLTVESVFGPPTKEGDVTIIPVAEMGLGFGFGFGQGFAIEDEDGEEEKEEKEEKEEETANTGEGGGAGGGGKATPRGYIKITPEGVSFESIMDDNQVAMAGIMMTAWSVFWIAKAIRAFAKK